MLLALVWGWSFLLIKVAAEGMTPAAVAFVRTGLGAATLVAVAHWQGLALPWRGLWPHFLVAGLLHNALPFTMLAYSSERISSALNAVLNSTTALFAAIAVAVAFGERLRRAQVVGLLLGVVGVGVAAGLSASDLGSASLAGAAGSVGAAACYGVAFVYTQRHLMGPPPVVAAACQLLAGTVLVAPVAVATTAANGVRLAPHRVLAVVVLGVVGTGLAYVLNYHNIAALGSTKASLVTYLIPVVAVAVGIAFLGEDFHPRLLAGGALIVAGIALVQGRLRLHRRAAVGSAP